MASDRDNDYYISRESIRYWLGQRFIWRIPVYQRHYAWEDDENSEKQPSISGPLQSFWEVVEEQAKKRLKRNSSDEWQPAPHYFGAILVEKIPSQQVTDVIQYDVVDGQQRLTTINIALFSLIRWAAKNGLKDKVKEQLAQYIFSKQSGDERKESKLQPTNFDRTQYETLLYHAYAEEKPAGSGERKDDDKSMVSHAYHFFNEKFEEFLELPRERSDEDAIEVLSSVLLDGLELVVIPLKEKDKAQKVFESMNNTARPLTTFDLIRNDIFYRAADDEKGLDEKLFRSEIWQQFEKQFWEDYQNKRSRTKHIEVYIVRMLIAKQKTLLQQVSTSSIFGAYKRFVADSRFVGVEHEIEAISEYVDVYKYLVGEISKNPIDESFDFGYFKSNHNDTLVFLPVIFTIATCAASVSERQRMIRLLESWVIRRSICNYTPKSINRQVPPICRKIWEDPTYSSLEDYLKESDEETRIFPKLDRVTNELLWLDFYYLKAVKKYVFQRLIMHNTSETRNEVRDIKSFSIDHILPRGWQENTLWKDALKDDEEDVVHRKMETIGNLTPLAKGTNSAKSNLAWDEGKERNGARYHLKQSDLKMTREIGEKNETWTIREIDERTESLAKDICDIWPDDIDEN